MNFSILKPILLFCGVSLLCDFVHGRFDLNNDGIVGVSQRNLEQYLTKAIKGFQKVILEGDDELGIAIMDPYELEDVFFEIVDPSGSEKYSLSFDNTNTTIIEGLSKYGVSNVKANAKDMKLSFEISFGNLHTKFPYKLEGYMLKNFLPLYGEGFVELSTQGQEMYFTVDLGIDQGFIIVERVLSGRYWNDININVTGLMDLPEPFASVVVDDILDSWVKKHGPRVLGKYVRDIVEEAVGGMTTEEFFDYLDHFVKKYEEQ